MLAFLVGVVTGTKVHTVGEASVYGALQSGENRKTIVTINIRSCFLIANLWAMAHGFAVSLLSGHGPDNSAGVADPAMELCLSLRVGGRPLPLH